MPAEWRRYTTRASVGLAGWLADFGRRLDRLAGVGAQGASVWLGGLFAPTSFITATRQAQARRVGVSLERMRLTLAADAGRGDGFALEGLAMQGASLDPDGALILNDGQTVALAGARIVWVDATSTAPASVHSSFGCPAYLDADRKDLLFSVDLGVAAGGDAVDFVQRGVCLLAHE